MHQSSDVSVVHHHGTIYRFVLNTEVASYWVESFVEDYARVGPWQFFCRVDSCHAGDLVEEMQADGLEVSLPAGIRLHSTDPMTILFPDDMTDAQLKRIRKAAAMPRIPRKLIGRDVFNRLKALEKSSAVVLEQLLTRLQAQEKSSAVVLEQLLDRLRESGKTQ